MTDLSEIHPDRLSRIRENVNEWPHIMVLSAPVLWLVHGDRRGLAEPGG
mgnify:CR=1 FL=1